MERKFYLDFLKVLATFGVIFIHVYARVFFNTFNTYNWYVAVVGESLVRWSVPVFVMISGVLFLNPLKELSTNIIIKKYVKRLLKAYIFWYIIYCLYHIVKAYLFSNSHSLDYKVFEPMGHLWFLPMIMCVYLLVPILRRVVRDVKLIVYVLTLWVVYLTINYLLFVDISQISSLFAMNIVVGYAGYFVLGYYLSLDILTRHQCHVIYLFGGMGIFVAILGSIGLSLSRDDSSVKFLDELSPQVLLTSVALFVFVMRQSPKIEIRLKRFTDYVRKDLFGIYLVHYIWHNIFHIGLIRNMCNQAISLVIIALLVFIFSLYTTKILRKIPFVSQFVE